MRVNLKKLKPWMLPVAILGGVLLHEPLAAVSWLSPWLIFVMLFITFCRVNPRDMVGQYRSHRAELLGLIAVQTVGAWILYFLCLPMGRWVAQGAYLCVLCPTATAAPVVTGMLGGSVSRVATYSIICNVVTAVLAPVALTLISDDEGGVEFVPACLMIAKKVAPLILAPMLLAFCLRRYAPKANNHIADHQSVSFYLWAIALFIIVGNAVGMIMNEPSAMVPQMVLMTGVALAACVAQFMVGRRIGALNDDPVSGAQGLGQKNTVLAIWMATTYLNPITSVAPAAYIVWQNIINSAQLMRKARMAQNT